MARKFIHDISVTLSEKTPLYPGDPLFQKQSHADMVKDGYRLTSFSMSAHFGTHIDGPAHFIDDGKGPLDYDISKFIMPAAVVEIDDEKAVSAEMLEGLDPGRAVLLKTLNSKRGLLDRKGYAMDYAHITEEAAAALVGLGAPLVGIDYISVDPHGSEDFPAHKALLSAGVLILESARLAEVDPGNYTLVCAPLKVDFEGAPARAFLMEDDRGLFR